MKTRLLLFFFCLSSLLLSAQKGAHDHLQEDEVGNKCGTADISDEEFQQLPWVGDNENLLRLIKKKEENLAQFFNNRSSNCSYVFGGEDLSNDPIVNVPVYFFIHRASGETGLPTVTDVNAIIDHTNSVLAVSNSQIRLAVHCVRYPLEPNYVIINDKDELDDMMQEHQDGPGINVHVVLNGYGWDGVYNPGEDAVAIKRDQITFTMSEVLAHEVGHFFTLPHTHKFTNLDPDNEDADGLDVPCGREAVSRNQVIDPSCGLPFPISHCNWTGDGFCDTPSDPNEGGSSYNKDWVDFLGVPYAPDDDNVMSYYRGTEHFSPMQVAAMWNDLLDRLGGGWDDILNGDFVIADTYEPNNSTEDATVLSLNDEQIHTLHDHCNRDMDWFVIEPGQVLGDHIIHVEKLSSCDWPVWDVRVFYINSSGLLVSFPGANVVQVNGKYIINVSCEDVENNELFIRVRNSFMPRGYYKIYMESEYEAEIAGPNSFCNQAEYEVTGIPSGASVTWDVSSGLSLSCQTCNPTTVQSIFNSGTVTVGATITHNGCTVKVGKEVTINSPTVPPFGIVPLIPACYDPFSGFGGFGEYMIANAASGVTYNWSVSGGSAWPSTGTFSTIGINSPGSFTITVEAVGPCGARREVKATFIAGPCERMRVNVSPNPAKDFLRVEVEDEIPENEEIGSTEKYLIIVNDLYGEVLYQEASDIKAFNLDISNYREGVYSLRVLRGDVQVATNFVVSRD